MEQHLISVDLGGSKVVAALGKRSLHNEIVVVDIVEVAMDGYTAGEITNIKNVTTAIQSAVTTLERQNGIKASEVWVGTSGKHIVCTDQSGSVFVGGAGGEITEQVVERLVENMNNVQAPDGKVILSRIPQNYKVDASETIGSPVGHFGNKLSTTFSFILGGKGVLDRIEDAFSRTGISTTHFVCGAMATASVVASEEEKEAGVAVIDLGAGTTDLCIIQNGIVRYAASIPIGSATINKDIQSIGVPSGTIERLKVNYGHATTSSIPADKLNNKISINSHSQYQKSKVISFRDLTTIIESRMLDIIDLVNKEIKASGYHNRLPNGIILTGGGSQLRGVEEVFAEHTGYDVRLGVAECNISQDSTQSAFTPAFATVVGLLSAGIEESIAPNEQEVEPTYTPEPAYTQAAPEPPIQEPVNPYEDEDDDEEDTTVGNEDDYFEDEDDNDGNDKPRGRKAGRNSEGKDGKKGGGKKFGKWLNDFFFGGNIIDDEM